MKIYLIGSGAKVAEIAEALSGRKSELHVISDDVKAIRDTIHKRAVHMCTDPATFDFTSLENFPNANDLIIIAESEEQRARDILKHLKDSAVDGQVVCFLSGQEKKLRREYPHVQFKSDQEIFGKELRELARKNATIRKVDLLREIVRSKPHLLILIYGNPDPDAIGSSCALRELLKEDAKEITIAYTGEYTRSENRAMARVLKVQTVKYKPEHITPETVVATVDAQPSFFGFDGHVNFDVVIDHHPEKEMGAPLFVDIRPEYGSACSILTEYFRHTDRAIPKRVATALYFGLKIDTNNLQRNVNDADVDAFRHLRTLADEDWLHLIELSQMPIRVLDHFAYAITHKKMAKDVAFCYLGTIDNPDTCVQVADFLVKVSEISWTVVSCRTGEKVVLVFRTDGFRKHAGKLASSLFSPYGSAGGHKTMARAELQTEKLREEIPEMTNEAIEDWLLRKLGERLRPLARLAK